MLRPQCRRGSADDVRRRRRTMGRLPGTSPRHRRRRVAPAWLFALAVGLVAAAFGRPAAAAETPAGSKNFTPPHYVPNYFSNESGALTGAIHRPGGEPRAPVYAEPRTYSRSSRGYAAAAHRDRHYRRHAAWQRHGRHSAHQADRRLAHRRVPAHRHFVHVAARDRRRPSLHSRPAAAHHRSAVRRHGQARLQAHIRRVARAGR